MTLIEVVVAMAIFLVLSAATLTIYQTVIMANRKSEVHSDSYRAAAIALKHIRSELRGAQVGLEVGSPPAAELAYQVPEWTSPHQVKVDRRGLPVAAAERTLRLRPTGELVTVEGPQERILARLGEGSLEFERVGEKLLRVHIVADIHGKTSRNDESRRELRASLGLATQQFWQDLTVLEPFSEGP